MGTWGTGLFSDDTAHDIKDDYIHDLRKGKTPGEAVTRLMETFRPEGSDDEGLFWVCLAVLQWDYGHLTPEIQEKALEHLPYLYSSDIWPREKDRAKRRQLAEEIGVKLTAPQLSPKKISKYCGKRCKWKAGEVYSMQFDDFQDPRRTPQQLRVFKDYAPYSNQFGAFCVVDIVRYEDSVREVIDEVPLVVIYDWVEDHRPTMEELAHVPTILFRDNYNFPENLEKYPVYNSICGDTPSPKDHIRNNIVQIGQTDRFQKEKFVPIHCGYPKMLSEFQCVLMQSRLYLAESLPR